MSADGVVFSCLAAGCGQDVCETEGHGLANCARRVLKHHPTVLLPEPRKRQPNKKPPVPQVNPANANPAGAVAADAAAPADADEPAGAKRARDDNSDLVDFIARTFQPFSILSDPYFADSGLTRRNIVAAMRRRLDVLERAFISVCAATPFSVAIDAGTNAGERTLNDVVCCGGASRVVGALRIDDGHTIENIKDAVVPIVRRFAPMTPAAFTSDNAANVRGATLRLAEGFGCQQFSCLCHGINLVVQKIVYADPVVIAGRAAADRARGLGPGLFPPGAASPERFWGRRTRRGKSPFDGAATPASRSSTRRPTSGTSKTTRHWPRLVPTTPDEERGGAHGA